MKQVTASKPARRRVFNLDTFAKETKEVNYDFPQTESDEDLVAFTTADYRKFADLYLRRKALADAKAKIQGASTSVVAKILAGYKVMPEFAADKFKNRTEQDVAIIEKIKSIPALFEFVKAQAQEASLKAAEEEDEDEEETE